ncbi:MAG: NAD(P)H-dependent oxidoreductase subunit E [Candidatus Electryonea clarkiae]|nr:NAD(P)H-dependent oxidoreductase subunit E [Candidatus Electryonea clarkiae]MDP8286864.1 NAD(P)H-dependent oxidoreductase subunit E [Candidatus Electryonea clarkiae]
MNSETKTKASKKKAAVLKSDTNGKLDQIFDLYPREEDSLIMILQEVQDRLNWLPPEALDRVADELNVPRARVQGVATFYRAFSLEPRGEKVIKVCLGTACHVRGAQILVDELERRLDLKVSHGCTKDGRFSLETVNCVGACAMAPAIVVNENYYANVKPDKLDKMLKKEQQS